MIILSFKNVYFFSSSNLQRHTSTYIYVNYRIFKIISRSLQLSK